MLYGGGGGDQGPGDLCRRGGNPGGEVVDVLDIAKTQSALGQIVHQVIVKRRCLVPSQDRQRLVHQIRQLPHIAVAGGQYGDKVGLDHRQGVPPLGGGQAAKTEIQLAFTERQQLVVGGEIVELDSHLRSLGAKAGDGGGHQDLGGHAKADAQGADIARQHVAGGARELLALDDHSAGILIQCPAQSGEASGTGVALEQLAAQLLLQPPYLFAQGRLGNMLTYRRLAEVQYLPQSGEGFQIP